MPKLLPPDWIQLVAREYIIRLYEKEPNFVKEWNDVKRLFTHSIQQMGMASALIDAEELSTKLLYKDLFASISYLKKLKGYLQNRLGNIDLSELRESYSIIQDGLTPYIVKLNEIAYKWNLRAPWVGKELAERDVDKVKGEIFDVAGVAELSQLRDLQIQRLNDQEDSSLPSYIWPINVFSLHLAGGRRGFVKQINEKLIEFEKELKKSGVKEPPSALRRHAEWWFDHYVNRLSYNDIADNIAQEMVNGGPHPQNIRKEILKFSKLIDVVPKEP